MPNWVYNGLTIEGHPEIVKMLVEQMNQPYAMIHDSWNMETKQMEVKQTTYPNPVFAFHNIFNHRQDNIDDLEYVKQPKSSELSVDDKNWWADTQEIAKTDNSWYNWNVRNWGTKWDVSVSSDNKYPDTYMEGPTPNGENSVVYYNFNTAWSPPFPAMEKLSAQYPSLLLTLSYEEETGWGGEAEFLRGKQISISEYGWMCRNCEHTEDETPYCDTCDFDMCPSCGYGEPRDEDRAECQTHGVELTPTGKE